MPRKIAERIVPKRLAPRLILALTLLVSVVTGISAYFNVRTLEEQLLEEKVLAVDQLSRSITSTTWEAMLLDQREAAYMTMKVVGEDKGIARIRIFNKNGWVTFSTTGETPVRVDQNAEACYMCHAPERPLVRVDTTSRARVFRGPDRHRLLGLVTPIYNAEACSTAPCHAHPPERRVLGVLDITIPLEDVERKISASAFRTLVSTTVEIALMAALIGVLVRQLVGKPIHLLIRGAKAITAMDLDQPFEVRAEGEIGELERSFQQMQEELKRKTEELNEFANQLEVKVEERSRELEGARQKLIMSDRLATLGQLAATVVHEINNPVAGVLNLAQLMDRLLTDKGVPPARLDEFRGYLRSVSSETSRIGRLVSDLLSFSRLSSPQRSDWDLNQIAEHTVSLVAHKLELEGLGLDLDLQPDLPPLLCDRSQIQQVIVNLVMNAADASSAGDRVRLGTTYEVDEDRLCLWVEDSGTGISEAHLESILDPFFTTKETGQGVGLGLSIVHGIVSAHGGSLSIATEVGVGSVFTVRLPGSVPCPNPRSEVRA